MRISGQLLTIGILLLTPFASIAQEVVPYAKSELRVDCVRGTEFSKYKTYAWGATRQTTPNPSIPLKTLMQPCRQRDCRK